MKLKKQSFSLLVISSLMVILTLFLLGLFLAQQNKQEPSPSKEENSPSNTEATINGLELKREPPPLKAKIEKKDKNCYLLITEFPEEELLLAYQLELIFDPEVFEIKEVEKGNFLPSSLVLEETINNERGKAIFSVGVLPKNQGEENLAPGEDKSLAIFHLYSQQEKNGEIYFGPKTILTGPSWYWENKEQVLPLIVFPKD